MVMDLIGINQFSKITYHLVLFKKQGVPWISDVDYRFDSGNVLSVNITPEKDMRMWKSSPLLLDSPDEG
jgi:hypothetical protein